MSTPTKLILSWDINKDSESEYFEFMVSEFIPIITRLGITDIQAWYTLYGSCEQILFSGIAHSQAEMNHIMNTDAWYTLYDKLQELVSNFEKKVIANGTGGFQL